jgi:hypothetical protein
MPCIQTDLGQFNYCDGVDVSETIDGPVDLLYLQTSRQCNYATGNFGILEKGEYVFTFEETNYKFEVV